MKKMTIHDNWKMRAIDEEAWRPAKVPGTMYSDLLAAGVIEDPYWRDNEIRALPFSDKDYEYVTQFDADAGIMACPDKILRFNGVDTIADIYLNGQLLGHAENMHRIWEYRANGILKDAGNELRVVFHSPVKYIKAEEKKEHWPTSFETMAGASHLRKAHCMFGWDWGIRLPDCGLYRDVELLGYEEARIADVLIGQEHEKRSDGIVVYITPKIEIAAKDGQIKKELSIKITVADPEGVTVAKAEGEGAIEIKSPRLWWPNGLGDQPLYTVTVSLMKGDDIIDTYTRRIGLRTLTVRREKDEYGESFEHQVNGVSYFAMGSNYIPEDSLIARMSPERTRDLLMQAAAAHHNSIRVWGGAFYPHDYFYDICDELGIVVWQDCMFACSIYMLSDKAFEENIKIEIEQVLKRIRHHACLGLISGNNEQEGFFESGSFGEDADKYRADYLRLYEDIIPKICAEHAPQTFYWPSSPSSGGNFTDTSDPHKGDVHNWDIWHGGKPFSEYRKFNFRYLSEFGFQSFPSIRTVEAFTEIKDRNIFSYVMEKHQRNFAANGKIMNYMEQTYLYPTDFDTLIYASQLLQADAIRYGIEHFRRHRGESMGTIVWQLNDCWPVASWSSIDYFGRWKALHYAEKRAFAPLMISCEEEGMTSQDPNPNAEPYELKKSIRLCVANESRQDENVTVRWQMRDAGAGVVEDHAQVIDVPAQSSVWLEKVDMMHACAPENYVSLQLIRNDNSGADGIYGADGSPDAVSEGTVMFVAPKYFHFRDPKLSVRSDGDEIVVTAEAYAKSVEIRNENDDLILSDNFFDMNGGEKRVKVLRGVPEGLKARSVYDIK